jgi:hypothetical protein
VKSSFEFAWSENFPGNFIRKRKDHDPKPRIFHFSFELPPPPWPWGRKTTQKRREIEKPSQEVIKWKAMAMANENGFRSSSEAMGKRKKLKPNRGIYLWIDQQIDFVVDDRVETLLLEELDGVLAVVVVAPAEEDQTVVLGDVDLVDVPEEIFGVGDDSEQLERTKMKEKLTRTLTSSPH